MLTVLAITPRRFRGSALGSRSLAMTAVGDPRSVTFASQTESSLSVFGHREAPCAHRDGRQLDPACREPDRARGQDDSEWPPPGMP